MSKLDRLNDRCDAAKWAHPELETIFAGGEAPSPTFAETFNPEIPFETRKATNEAFLASMQPFFLPINPEKATTYDIPGCPEEPETEAHILVTKPTEIKKKLPCILFVPSGGLYACIDRLFNGEYMANEHGAVIVACTYRTVFNGGGYPQTINDLHATYKWIVENAEELGINPDKVLVYGQSSGGHLALALCHRLKKYGYQPRGCVVESPITDERTIYPSSKRIQSWGGREVYASGQAWLGYQHANPATVPAEAFAGHATPEECVGLPPTFIHTYDSEISADASMQYASKLIQAGVFTDLHVWGGSGHSVVGTYAMVPKADREEYTQLILDTLKKQVKDCFQYDLRRQWIAEELNKED